jgi:type I restriction enzyme S subunit
MPELDQQKSVVAVFKRLDALKGLQSETAAELNALLPAILDRAFKGEL